MAPPVTFKTLSTEHDLQKKLTKSSIKAKIGADAAIKLKHAAPGNKFSLEADYKTWEFKYDVPSKDFEVEKKWKVRIGELKIKQKVPGSNWSLVPAPEVQLKAKPVNTKRVVVELEPSYSLLDRKAKIEASAELDKRHKLKLEADSKTGPRAATFALSTKPRGGLARAAKQLTLKYSVNAGPSLIHEVEPGKVSLKTTLGLKARDVKVVAEVKPGKSVAGLKPKLSLEAKTSLKAPTKPALIAGLSLDL